MNSSATNFWTIVLTRRKTSNGLPKQKEKQKELVENELFYDNFMTIYWYNCTFYEWGFL